jgi:lysophospholipase L1-like esterase
MNRVIRNLIAIGRLRNGGGSAPLLPFSDDFSSALPGWLGNGWSLVTGKAQNVPILGDTLVANGNMEAGSPPTGWTPYHGATSADADAHGGSQALKMTLNTSDGNAYYSFSPTIKRWHVLDLFAKLSAGTLYYVAHYIGGKFRSPNKTNVAYEEFYAVFVPENATNWIQFIPYDGDGAAALLDDIYVKPVTSDYVYLRETDSSDIAIVAEINRPTTSSVGGLILCADSATAPLNYVAVVLDLNYNGSGAVYKLYKCVNGDVTLVYTVAADWTEGDRLKIIKSGTSYSIFHDRALVGITQTVNEATINNNTMHGLISLTAGVTFDNLYMNTNAIRIVTLGDSITDGTLTWSERLVNAYRYGCNRYFKRAIAGGKIMSGAQSMDVQTLAAASDDADYILILLGENDTASDDLTTEYQENITELATSNTRATIYCMGVTPSSSADRDTKNTKIAAAVAGAVLAGANAVYWNTDGWIDYATETSDGVHPTAAGAIKIMNRVLALLPA